MIEGIKQLKFECGHQEAIWCLEKKNSKNTQDVRGLAKYYHKGFETSSGVSSK